MQKILLTLLFLANLQSLNAQNCVYKNLSKNFNFSTSLKRFESNLNDSFLIKLFISNQQNNAVLQTISVTSNWLFDTEFIDCNAARSYITHVNEDSPVADNHYGSIIVADFNFDTREDVAILNNSGGNGGPTYNFYIQNKDRIFVLDNFLTYTMEFFPAQINRAKKTLTTLVHASAISLSKNTYQYNRTQKKWKKINHTFVSN